MDMRLLLLGVLILAAGCLGPSEEQHVGSVGAVDGEYPMTIVLYYGSGCPHCASIQNTILQLETEYNLTVVKKEVYYDPALRQEMYDAYTRFGKDPSQGGVPTMIIGNRSMVIGEVKKERFEEILNLHIVNETFAGVFTQYSFEQY